MAQQSDGLHPETSVGRVALRVGDLEATGDFYESVVGLTRRREDEDRLVLGIDDQSLLELHHAPELAPRGPDETGLFHTAFRVPTRSALADALVRLRDRWNLTGASDHLVSEALYCSDPAGNGVEVYHDRPQADWPVAPDGSVEMDTLPLALEDLRGEVTGADGMPPETDVGHVHLEVSSIQAAREFYADALGMNVRATYGSDALFLAAGDYHHHVGLNVWNGKSEPAEGRGLAWFELMVPDEATLSGVRERLEEAGFDLTVDDGTVRVTDQDDIEVRLVVGD